MQWEHVTYLYGLLVIPVLFMLFLLALRIRSRQMRRWEINYLFNE